jgi:hypothetical protein
MLEKIVCYQSLKRNLRKPKKTYDLSKRKMLQNVTKQRKNKEMFDKSNTLKKTKVT